MGVSWCLCWALVTLLHILYFQSNNAQPSYYLITNHTTISWTNNNSTPNANFSIAPAVGRLILLRETWAFGFLRNSLGTEAFFLGVFTMFDYEEIPRVVWSANRNKPVRYNANLHLTSEGDLVLQDVDGTLVWSTNSTGKSVAGGMNLTDTGNLVLFDENNATIWHSFDHPTDTLLLRQKLFYGQKLTASVSATNWSEGGLYSLTVTKQGLVLFIQSDPPYEYFFIKCYGKEEGTEPDYVTFQNGSFALFVTSCGENLDNFLLPQARSSMQHMKLDSDGHLRVYDYWWLGGWQSVADILTSSIGGCGYPMACGRYGICSSNDKVTVDCSCPSRYFIRIDDKHPNFGCSEITPLSCEAYKYHRLVELKNVTHPADRVDINNTDVKTCKQACLRNCSCKAALFYPDGHYCFFLSQIFSLREYRDSTVGSRLFIKLQIDPSAPAPLTAVPSAHVPPRKKTSQHVITLVGSLGAFFVFCLVIGICGFFSWKQKEANDIEEDYLDQVPGMPMRFSCEELKAATENFKTKLGQGGFGTVIEGTLNSGTKVAVKRLDSLTHVKKSFLAEVKSIGSTHHVNLVRLVGYCAEKSHRLLIYEYMCNGSLDEWIFQKKQELALDWQTRKKIILDIAKGLTYLHEDCRQKIVHLDIKPQNIILDVNFNAKVADFGLSKLIDKDQSQVVTTMRGTLGYLAPEWLNSVITEKVDVYSFNVVVLEILCGRKNLDRTQPEEDMHLLSLFKRKAEEEQPLDIVDKCSEDMQFHGADVVGMMRVAAWCLQSDFSKRPPMSVVVKVLEGSIDVEDPLDYNFTTLLVPRSMAAADRREVAATPLLPSTLSGPR